MSEKLDRGCATVPPDIAGIRVGGGPEMASPSGACATPWASQGSGSDPQQNMVSSAPKEEGVESPWVGEHGERCSYLLRLMRLLGFHPTSIHITRNVIASNLRILHCLVLQAPSWPTAAPEVEEKCIRPF
jgi:hypothetical protein